MQKSAAEVRDFVLIYVNGTRYEVRGASAFQSLSDYLRLELGLVGTKIVCAEGDCGACALLIGRYDAESSDGLKYSSADACILFVWQLDCCHVVTIEGLAAADSLHPVQKAMVDCHGSQCGFCTPGFVMQLTDLLNGRESSPSVDDIRLSLSGSLCRCTGYVPIIEAAQSLTGGVPNLNEQYSAARMIQEFAAHSNQIVDIFADAALPLSAGNALAPRRLYLPTTLADAVRFKAEHPEALTVSGGTEFGVRVNKHLVDPTVVLGLTRLPRALERVSVEGRALRIGGRASWASIERVCQEHLPEFSKIIRLFGGPAIRNVATMAGNIANGSPIADGLPVMMVLLGSMELVSPRGRRSVAINDFYRGYKQMDLAADELISEIRLPLPSPGDRLNLYKVSKRRDLDISTFTAALWMQLEDDRIVACRIAYGGVAPTVVRLPKTEAMLMGQPFDEDTFQAAGRIARAEVTPISDVRGSADFRLQLCENVLVKFYWETVDSLLATNSSG